MEVAVRRKAPGPLERKMVGGFVRSVLRWQPGARRTPLLTQLGWEPVTFGGNTGAVVAGRWFPHPHAKGTVVLCHPDRRAGQQWFVPKGYVEFLHDAGFHVLTFDFAGYGDTRGGSTYLLEDVVGACRFARDRAPVPVHLFGVSIGAFSAINAAPFLDFVQTLILESPFPSFNAWYGRRFGRLGMSVFDAVFPRTAALIQADENIRRTNARRILIVASDGDLVTPMHLTDQVADASDPTRTTYLRLATVDHLRLFEESDEYRDAIRATLG